MILTAGVAALLTPGLASAGTYYWDVNGTATGFSTITGAWNGTNAFWNTDVTGAALGATTATVSNADDVYVSGGTTGTITLTGALAVSSLSLEANVATTVTGGTSLTLGGTGVRSGISANSSAASTVSSPLLLNAAQTAFAFSNAGSGLLTIGTGTLTGAASVAQTITVGASSTGGVTLSGIIANGVTGGTVGLVINSTGTGVTTLSGASTFSGGVAIRSGAVVAGVNAAFGSTSSPVTLGDTSGTASASISTANTIANAITLASGSTGNTLTLGNSTATSTATFSGALTLNHDLVVAAQGTGTVILSGKISGAGNITASAPGTLTISGAASDYTGSLNFSGGQLNLNEASALGGNTGTFTLASQRLDNTAGSAVVLTSTKAKAWNSDFTFLGSRALTFGTGAVTLSGDRIVTVNTTATSSAAFLTENGAIGDNGSGFSLTKAGPGTLNLNGTNTYGGATTVTGGALNLTGTNSRLNNTTALNVTGGSVNFGATSGVGVANRIASGVPVTLGGASNGASLLISAGATGPVNSQTFSSLTLGIGSNVLGSTSATNAGTLNFSDSSASVYSRVVGSTLRLQALGTSSLFTNAPTGSSVVGSGSSAILLGAVSGTGANNATDFVQAKAGAIAAPTYTSNAWASGNNTDVIGSYAIPSGSTTQSLRFNSVYARTLTLAGTNTIESGGILVSSNATSGNTYGTIQAINGGTLQAASGQDLWIHTVGTAGQDLTIGSLIADNAGSSLTKAGGRILYLTNAGNTYSGGTYLNEGTLNITSGGALGTGPLAFGVATTLQSGAAGVNLGTRGISIATGQTATIDTNGNSLAAGGVISGDGNLTKIGNGTLTLSGASTYTGSTSVSRGTLRLDFEAAASANNILSSTSRLILSQYNTSAYANSATLEIQGKAGTPTTQTFASTIVGRGASHLDLTAGAGSTLVVNLGGVNRNFQTGVIDPAAQQGSTLDIKIGAGVTVSTSTTSTSNGIFVLSGHSAVTVNGNTWAALSGGNIIGLSSYATTVSATANLDVSGTALTLSAAGGAVNTLRFNATNAGSSLNLATGGVRQISTGGILVTPNVGANASTIGVGLLAGASRRDLILFQNNPSGILQIDSTITDFNGGSMVNTKSGVGTVLFTADNANTGPTYVNEGTVIASGDFVPAPTGVTGSITVNTNSLTVSDPTGIVPGMSVTSGTVLTDTSSRSATVLSVVGNVVTLSSNANASSLTNAPLTFTAMGALGGGLTSIHQVAQGATLQIGNGGTSGSLPSGQGVNVNGALILDRSNAFTFPHVISGIGTLEKKGAGDVTLNNANTYTGGTKISGGSIILANSSAIGTGTLDYNSYGGSLSFGTLTTFSLGGLKGDQDLALANTTPAAVSLTVGTNGQSTSYSGGFSGSGSLTKSGGGTFTLAGANTHAGTTTVSNGGLVITGSLTGAGDLNIGSNNTNPVTATFSGSGSYSNVAGRSLQVASAGTGIAILNIEAGTSITSNNNGANGGNFTIGTAANSVGVVNQTGGSVTLNGLFRIANTANATASYGFYNQTGGSLSNLAGAGTGARFRIADSVGSATGLYYLSGGTATYAGGSVDVGASGTFGDQADAHGVLYVTGTGSFSAPNSSLNVGQPISGAGSSLATGQVTIGGAGSTTASVTSSSVITASPVGTVIGNSVINLLTGGTLTTGNFSKGSTGSSYLNFDGGTLKVGTTGTTLNAISGVYLYSGGATIDTDNRGYTVAAALLAPSAFGVNNIPIADGGADYVGAPAVRITGGTGVGATGVATISNGRVTGIVITNPGTGYQPSDVLTVTLTGGGASVPATLGSASFVANTSGGLTKNGLGNLVLSGASNYTGPTVISGGSLEISGSIGNGAAGTAISVGTGASMILSGASTDRIKTGSTLELDGGTLGFADSLNTRSESIDSLTLSAASVLDFGTGNSNTFNFTGGITGLDTFTLQIWGWSGPIGGSTQDHLTLGAGLTAEQLSQISFYSGKGTGFLGTADQMVLGGGSGFEVVPVPEPSSAALLASMGLFGLSRFRARRRGKQGRVDPSL